MSYAFAGIRWTEVDVFDELIGCEEQVLRRAARPEHGAIVADPKNDPLPVQAPLAEATRLPATRSCKYEAGRQFFAEHPTHCAEVAALLAFKHRNQFGFGFSAARTRFTAAGGRSRQLSPVTCAIDASASSEFFTRSSASTHREAVTAGITWLIGP